MNLFLVTFAVFILVMVAMAVGVILNNRAINGSCGGLNNIDGLKGACDICEIKKACDHRRQMERKALTK
jgi:hypothetical protein